MSLDRTKICSQLTVVKKIHETADTVSLVFEIPQSLVEKFKYKAGQFVTLFLDISGEEIRRSYSLASSPEYDSEFKVSVKLVPGGKGSTFLVQQTKVGDQLWVTPPAGLFCLPPDTENKKIAFYAAGSGITPIISLIKSALKKYPTVQCALLYQNKNESSVIFANELELLQKEFAPRFQVTPVMSQPRAGWRGLQGRTDKNVVRDFLVHQGFGISALQFICGPEAFMQAVETSLQDLNVAKSNIIKESFTVSHAAPSPEHLAGASVSSASFDVHEDDILIGEREKMSAPETLEAIVEGETHVIPYQKDATILDCLLDAGLNPPYSCLDGACMACMAKVEEGLVYQNDMGILTDDNLEAKECLTCQARPASKKVKIHYETT